MTAQDTIPAEVRRRWHTARLDVEFYSPPVWYTPPILDSVVAYALNRRATAAEGRASYCGPAWDRHGIWLELRHLVRQAGGCSICSELQPEGPAPQFRESIKKRFEARYRDLIDWGPGRKHKLNTSAAPWRAYDKPMPARSVLRAYWLLCGDVDAILALLQEHVVGIGKDVNAGYGWVRRLWATEVGVATHEILALRPVPVAVARQLGLTGGRVEVRAWKCPYWRRANMAECLCPN